MLISTGNQISSFHTFYYEKDDYFRRSSFVNVKGNYK